MLPITLAILPAIVSHQKNNNDHDAIRLTNTSSSLSLLVISVEQLISVPYIPFVHLR